MTSRVYLVAPAGSASLRQARFYDGGGPIDDAGAESARAAAGSLPSAARVLLSPGVRCRETAEALGLDGTVVPELAGLDVGRWRGRALDEVGAAEPEAVGRWLTDPDCAPHGGETVTGFCARVGDLLSGGVFPDGRTVAVVEPEVVRAVVVQVLGAPEAAFWRLDVPPLTVTELSGRSGRWNLRLGRPPHPAGAAPAP
ncbi:histidine phosphatase family protein [Streptomyces sp. SID486]|uniref:histidine phosphatase family protein n=1 Tax=unclassified Streptomyces TaxID=2593676 RepID=UPI001369457A|nr:histidine phosphatase family protein [Streptomyces sp. SID486]MYX97774.1 histidine phosphatase family protein [Streptomyces sp. SID486]